VGDARPVPTYHVALLDDVGALDGEVQRLGGLGAQVLAASGALAVEEGRWDLAAAVLIARWPGPVPDGAAGAAARVVATFTGLGAEAAVPVWVPPHEHDARFPRAVYDLVGVDVHDVPGFLRYIGRRARAARATSRSSAPSAGPRWPPPPPPPRACGSTAAPGPSSG
jgi:hypothetical protein